MVGGVVSPHFRTHLETYGDFSLPPLFMFGDRHPLCNSRNLDLSIALSLEGGFDAQIGPRTLYKGQKIKQPCPTIPKCPLQQEKP